jgi:hypothetical protein
MADVKISGLPASTTPLAGTEVLPVVQGGQTRQVSVANLTAGRNISAADLTTTGNTILGNASTDTLNVGNGGLVKDASGNVGIGTTTPSSYGKLVVYSASGSVFANVSSGTNQIYVGYDNALTTSAIETNTDLAFLTGASFAERMRVFAAGGVSIGTNSAAGAGNLLVAGKITSTDNTNYTFEVKSGGSAIATIGGTTGTNNLVFQTNGAEQMRLNNAGTVILKGGSTSATGVGITFPATQSASTDVNTLDDYEEGTWTPTQGGGLTVIGAYSSSGSYTKIGNLVTVIGQIEGATSVAVSSGGLLVGGLPFTTGAVPATATGGLTNVAVTATSLAVAAGTNVYATTAVVATTRMYFTITYKA